MSSYFDESELERVRQATDLAELIGGYVTLKRRSPIDLWGRCPFHSEKSASFHVRPDRGMFHCFGCGKGGNAITFVMEIERLSFGEAVRMLAEKAGITLAVTESREPAGSGSAEREQLFHACSVAEKWFHERLIGGTRSKEADAAFHYLAGRGIGLDLIKRFRIGFAETGWDGLVNSAIRAGVGGETLVRAGLAYKKKSGEGYVDRFRARIIFPIQSLAGKSVAFGGRRVEGITPDEDGAKYVNSAETSIYHKGEHLHGLVTARDEIRRSGNAYLVEGYIDLLAMVQAGILNVVASLGTALTEEQAKLLSRFSGRVVIVYDGDDAGRTAAVRAADLLTIAGVEARMALLPAGDDPDSLLRKSGSKALYEMVTKEKSFVQFRLETAGLDGQMGQKELLNAAKGVLETLRSLRDPLQRDLLLSELANLTGLRRDVIDKSVGDSRRGEGETVTTASKLIVPPDQIAERDLLHALLSHPSLIPEAMVAVDAEQFEHLGLKAIYLAMEQDYLSGRPPSPESVIDKLADPMLRAFLAEASLSSESWSLEAAKEEMQKCASLLIKRIIQREQEEINQKLCLPGNSAEVTRALRLRLVELIRQLQALKSQ